LNPYFLVHKNVRSDFSDVLERQSEREMDSVVVGDAREEFNYENLNKALRVLHQTRNPELISMGGNKLRREKNGQLALAISPFVKALEDATGVTAQIVGKPSSQFFHRVLKDMGCTPQNAVMIGDDIDADIAGSLNIGLKALLVCTGNYRRNYKLPQHIQPTDIVQHLKEAVEWIVKHNKSFY